MHENVKYFFSSLVQFKDLFFLSTKMLDGDSTILLNRIFVLNCSTGDNTYVIYAIGDTLIQNKLRGLFKCLVYPKYCFSIKN